MNDSSSLSDDSMYLCALCGHTSTGGDVHFEHYDYVLKVVVLPILASIGLFGGVVSVLVFLTPAMRSSLNCYLAALAVFDSLVCMTAVFMLSFEEARGRNPFIRDLFFGGITVVYPLATCAQTASVYTTLAACLDCFVAACLGRWKRQFCTMRRARTVIFGICIFALAYNISHFFEVTVRPCFDNETNETRVEVCTTELRRNVEYHVVYYVYLYTALMTVVPLVVLIVLNTCIIVVMAREKSKRNSGAPSLARGLFLPPPDLMGAVSGSIPLADKSGDDTVTLIVVVILFIVCNTLSLVVNFLESFANLGSVINYLVNLSNLLVVINSAANFFIYLIFNPLYRHTVMHWPLKALKQRRETSFTRCLTSGEIPRVNSSLSPPTATVLDHSSEHSLFLSPKQDTSCGKGHARFDWRPSQYFVQLEAHTSVAL